MLKLSILLIAILIGIFGFFHLINLNQTINQNEFTFVGGSCDESIDPWDESELGIKQINWTTANSVVISGNVSMNCAENALTGRYTVENNNLSLEYFIPKCKTCARCMCGSQLTFTIPNLPKTDYQIQMKRVER